MKNNVILVTGCNGQVGRSLKKIIDQSDGFSGLYFDRSKLDLSTPSKISVQLDSIKFDAIINAAAYTQVDKAEDEKDLAQAINVKACAELAKICQERNIPIIHYSSDYVYHNSENRPLEETDATEPKSIYAITKLDGEKAIIKNCEKHFILRTSWVYHEDGKNFVHTMLRLAENYPKLTVVDDQIGCPTYAADIATVSLALLNKSLDPSFDNKNYGVYNFSNEGVCSWFDFAKAIFRIAKKDIPVVPVGTENFPLPAPRPSYSVLSKKKIRKVLGADYLIPHWEDGLRRCMEAIKPNRKYTD